MPGGLFESSGVTGDRLFDRSPSSEKPLGTPGGRGGVRNWPGLCDTRGGGFGPGGLGFDQLRKQFAQMDRLTAAATVALATMAPLVIFRALFALNRPRESNAQAATDDDFE